MELNRLELLILRRMIQDTMDKKMDKIHYYHHCIQKGKDFYNKLAIAESEYENLVNIRKKINDEMTLLEYTNGVYSGGESFIN